eukprot:m.784521 g.784521  ORF g.784521 m.784521 type:complete len:1221 (-) comp23299_c0_seq1:314-3976(-)
MTTRTMVPFAKSLRRTCAVLQLIAALFTTVWNNPLHVNAQADSLVGSCLPNLTSTSQAFACALLPTPNPVCDFTTGVSYRNPSCASCNNVANFKVGSCSAPGPPTISSCPSGTGTIELNRCIGLDAELTCSNGTLYWNAGCAACNGGDPNQFIYGECNSTDPFIGTCPTTTSSPNDIALCTGGGLEPVCGVDRITYRNRFCAVCNGVLQNATAGGPCGADTTPCDSQQCLDNAHCALSVLDCSFDYGRLCGWTGIISPVVASTAASPLPTTDSTRGGSSGGGVQGAFVVLTPPSSTFTSPIVNLTAYGSGRTGASTTDACTLSVSVYRDPTQASQTPLVVQTQPTVGAAYTTVWTLPAFTGGAATWVPYTISLPAARSAIRFAVPGGTIPVAIDDVALTCDEPGQGVCACDAGYSPAFTGTATASDHPYSECSPMTYTVLAGNADLSVFTRLVQLAGLEATLLSLSPMYTVIAPTDAAFALLPNNDMIEFFGSRANATALVQYLLLVASPSAPTTGLAFLETSFNQGFRTAGTASLSNPTMQLVSVDPRTIGGVVLGNSSVVVDFIGAANGDVLVTSTVPLPSEFSPGPTQACGALTCDPQASCGTRTATLSLDASAFAPYSTTACPSCGPQSPATYVCGADGRTYRSQCHATCLSASVLYAGGCIVPECSCNFGFVGNGTTCRVAPTPGTAAPTISTTPAPTREPMPYIEFYFNGSYFEVVEGLRNMMADIFSQLVRESVTDAADLSNAEAANLVIDTYPSARMPGFIMCSCGTYDATVLQQISDAVDGGRISLWYEQPNWEVDTSRLPPTRFLARPMDEDTLPPITTYYFYVDASYRSVICQPTSFGTCSYVRLNQEDFADEIRWFLNNEASMDGVGNSSLVYIWPYECKRVGFEDKIEVMASSLQVNNKLLLTLRDSVNAGQLTVFHAVTPTEEETYFGKPFPVDSTTQNGAAPLQADIGPYPGYSGTGGAVAPAQGYVDVSASLGTAGHLKLFYNLIVTEPGATGGVHIHSGTSCATVDGPGGHFYSTEVDQWAPAYGAVWTSDLSGIAVGTFDVFSGIPLADNTNHVVVVHNSAGGRIGCGVLTQTFAPVNLPRAPLRSNFSDEAVTGSGVVAAPSAGKDTDYATATVVVVVLFIVLLVGVIAVALRVSSVQQQAKSIKSFHQANGEFSNPAFGEDEETEEHDGYTDDEGSGGGYLEVNEASTLPTDDDVNGSEA